MRDCSGFLQIRSQLVWYEIAYFQIAHTHVPNYSNLSLKLGSCCNDIWDSKEWLSMHVLIAEYIIIIIIIIKFITKWRGSTKGKACTRCSPT